MMIIYKRSLKSRHIIPGACLSRRAAARLGRALAKPEVYKTNPGPRGSLLGPSPKARFYSTRQVLAFLSVRDVVLQVLGQFQCSRQSCW